MCGRYTLMASPDDIVAHFDLDSVPAFVPRYNIAPTQPVAVVTPGGTEEPSDPVRSSATPRREWRTLLWGLIPSWAKDPSIGSRLINARADGVAEKPSFRAAFKRRRCLIVADGFYEWKKLPKGKQPCLIRLREGGPFAFAGLWERWMSPDGGALESCAIITTEPNDLLREVHDRMPVILDRGDFEAWLDVSRPPKEAQSLLVPFPSERMAVVPVGTLVNNPRNDVPACAAPSKE